MFTYRAFSFCLYHKKGSLRIRLRFQRFLSFSENSSFQNTTEAQKRNLNRKLFTNFPLHTDTSGNIQRS